MPVRLPENCGEATGMALACLWTSEKMKILLSSYAFYPSIGGLEAVSEMMAEQFSLRGHEVVVITNTVGENKPAPYRVVRRPGPRHLFRLVRWCDVFLHNNINLRSAWPLLICRRPWVVANHGSITDDWIGRLKRFSARFAATSGVSEDAAQRIGSTVILPNCYEDEVFRKLPGVEREGELICVARLVSGKGVAVLLRALHQLRSGGLTPKLMVVGSGPEEASLQALTTALGLDAQVKFSGVKRGEELARELNRHKILVAPSTSREGFGIVALEGIACGCVVVGSERGGLRDAIGPCGVTFPNGDAAALARCLWELLTDEQRILEFRSLAAQHLAQFRKDAVAEAYLSMLGRLCSPNGRSAQAAA